MSYPCFLSKNNNKCKLIKSQSSALTMKFTSSSFLLSLFHSGCDVIPQQALCSPGDWLWVTKVKRTGPIGLNAVSNFVLWLAYGELLTSWGNKVLLGLKDTHSHTHTDTHRRTHARPLPQAVVSFCYCHSDSLETTVMRLQLWLLSVCTCACVHVCVWQLTFFLQTNVQRTH